MPLTILAGSDRVRGSAPRGSSVHPLVGYKGAALRKQGRPLVAHLVDRATACGVFDPIEVVGPRRIYAPVGIAVRDSDGSVAQNVRSAVDAFLVQRPAGVLAFLTCDVLPSAQELQVAVADQRAHAPAAWYGLIRAPAQRARLGASAWKPEYAVRLEHGAEPILVLPGHLLIVDPRALRLELVLCLLDVAYRTRNRPPETRRRRLVQHVLPELLRADAKHLLAGRVPRLTWNVLRSGRRIARGLEHASLTLDELQRLVGRVVLRARHRRLHGPAGVRIPVLDALGLALDIDTEEEAQAFAVQSDSADVPDAARAPDQRA